MLLDNLQNSVNDLQVVISDYIQRESTLVRILFIIVSLILCVITVIFVSLKESVAKKAFSYDQLLSYNWSSIVISMFPLLIFLCGIIALIFIAFSLSNASSLQLNALNVNLNDYLVNSDGLIMISDADIVKLQQNQIQLVSQFNELEFQVQDYNSIFENMSSTLSIDNDENMFDYVGQLLNSLTGTNFDSMSSSVDNLVINMQQTNVNLSNYKSACGNLISDATDNYTNILQSLLNQFVRSNFSNQTADLNAFITTFLQDENIIMINNIFEYMNQLAGTTVNDVSYINDFNHALFFISNFYYKLNKLGFSSPEDVVSFLNTKYQVLQSDESLLGYESSNYDFINNENQILINNLSRLYVAVSGYVSDVENDDIQDAVKGFINANSYDYSMLSFFGNLLTTLNSIGFNNMQINATNNVSTFVNKWCQTTGANSCALYLKILNLLGSIYGISNPSMSNISDFNLQIYDLQQNLLNNFSYANSSQYIQSNFNKLFQNSMSSAYLSFYDNSSNNGNLFQIYNDVQVLKAINYINSSYVYLSSNQVNNLLLNVWQEFITSLQNNQVISASNAQVLLSSLLSYANFSPWQSALYDSLYKIEANVSVVNDYLFVIWYNKYYLPLNATASPTDSATITAFREFIIQEIFSITDFDSLISALSTEDNSDLIKSQEIFYALYVMFFDVNINSFMTQMRANSVKISNVINDISQAINCTSSIYSQYAQFNNLIASLNSYDVFINWCVDNGKTLRVINNNSDGINMEDVQYDLLCLQAAYTDFLAMYSSYDSILANIQSETLVSMMQDASLRSLLLNNVYSDAGFKSFAKSYLSDSSYINGLYQSALTSLNSGVEPSVNVGNATYNQLYSYWVTEFNNLMNDNNTYFMSNATSYFTNEQTEVNALMQLLSSAQVATSSYSYDGTNYIVGSSYGNPWIDIVTQLNGNPLYVQWQNNIATLSSYNNVVGSSLNANIYNADGITINQPVLNTNYHLLTDAYAYFSSLQAAHNTIVSGLSSNNLSGLSSNSVFSQWSNQQTYSYINVSDRLDIAQKYFTNVQFNAFDQQCFYILMSISNGLALNDITNPLYLSMNKSFSSTSDAFNYFCNVLFFRDAKQYELLSSLGLQDSLSRFIINNVRYLSMSNLNDFDTIVTSENTNSMLNCDGALFVSNQSNVSTGNVLMQYWNTYIYDGESVNNANEFMSYLQQMNLSDLMKFYVDVANILIAIQGNYDGIIANGSIPVSNNILSFWLSYNDVDVISNASLLNCANDFALCKNSINVLIDSSVTQYLFTQMMYMMNDTNVQTKYILGSYLNAVYSGVPSGFNTWMSGYFIENSSIIIEDYIDCVMLLNNIIQSDLYDNTNPLYSELVANQFFLSWLAMNGYTISNYNQTVLNAAYNSLCSVVNVSFLMNQYANCRNVINDLPMGYLLNNMNLFTSAFMPIKHVNMIQSTNMTETIRDLIDVSDESAFYQIQDDINYTNFICEQMLNDMDNALNEQETQVIINQFNNYFDWYIDIPLNLSLSEVMKYVGLWNVLTTNESDLYSPTSVSNPLLTILSNQLNTSSLFSLFYNLAYNYSLSRGYIAISGGNVNLNFATAVDVNSLAALLQQAVNTTSDDFFRSLLIRMNSIYWGNSYDLSNFFDSSSLSYISNANEILGYYNDIYMMRLELTKIYDDLLQIYEDLSSISTVVTSQINYTNRFSSLTAPDAIEGVYSFQAQGKQVYVFADDSTAATTFFNDFNSFLTYGDVILSLQTVLNSQVIDAQTANVQISLLNQNSFVSLYLANNNQNLYAMSTGNAASAQNNLTVLSGLNTYLTQLSNANIFVFANRFSGNMRFINDAFGNSYCIIGNNCVITENGVNLESIQIGSYFLNVLTGGGFQQLRSNSKYIEYSSPYNANQVAYVFYKDSSFNISGISASNELSAVNNECISAAYTYFMNEYNQIMEISPLYENIVNLISQLISYNNLSSLSVAQSQVSVINNYIQVLNQTIANMPNSIFANQSLSLLNVNDIYTLNTTTNTYVLNGINSILGISGNLFTINNVISDSSARLLSLQNLMSDDSGEITTLQNLILSLQNVTGTFCLNLINNSDFRNWYNTSSQQFASTPVTDNNMSILCDALDYFVQQRSDFQFAYNQLKTIADYMYFKRYDNDINDVFRVNEAIMLLSRLNLYINGNPLNSWNFSLIDLNNVSTYSYNATYSALFNSNNGLLAMMNKICEYDELINVLLSMSSVNGSQSINAEHAQYLQSNSDFAAWLSTNSRSLNTASYNQQYNGFVGNRNIINDAMCYFANELSNMENAFNAVDLSYNMITNADWVSFNKNFTANQALQYPWMNSIGGYYGIDGFVATLDFQNWLNAPLSILINNANYQNWQTEFVKNGTYISAFNELGLNTNVDMNSLNNNVYLLQNARIYLQNQCAAYRQLINLLSTINVYDASALYDLRNNALFSQWFASYDLVYNYSLNLEILQNYLRYFQLLQSTLNASYVSVLQSYQINISNFVNQLQSTINLINNQIIYVVNNNQNVNSQDLQASIGDMQSISSNTLLTQSQQGTNLPVDQMNWSLLAYFFNGNDSPNYFNPGSMTNAQIVKQVINNAYNYSNTQAGNSIWNNQLQPVLVDLVQNTYADSDYITKCQLLLNNPTFMIYCYGSVVSNVQLLSYGNLAANSQLINDNLDINTNLNYLLSSSFDYDIDNADYVKNGLSNNIVSSLNELMKSNNNVNVFVIKDVYDLFNGNMNVSVYDAENYSVASVGANEVNCNDGICSSIDTDNWRVVLNENTASVIPIYVPSSTLMSGLVQLNSLIASICNVLSYSDVNTLSSNSLYSNPSTLNSLINQYNQTILNNIVSYVNSAPTAVNDLTGLYNALSLNQALVLNNMLNSGPIVSEYGDINGRLFNVNTYYMYDPNGQNLTNTTSIGKYDYVVGSNTSMFGAYDVSLNNIGSYLNAFISRMPYKTVAFNAMDALSNMLSYSDSFVVNATTINNVNYVAVDRAEFNKNVNIILSALDFFNELNVVNNYIKNMNINSISQSDINYLNSFKCVRTMFGTLLNNVNISQYSFNVNNPQGNLNSFVQMRNDISTTKYGKAFVFDVNLNLIDVDYLSSELPLNIYRVIVDNCDNMQEAIQFVNTNKSGIKTQINAGYIVYIQSPDYLYDFNGKSNNIYDDFDGDVVTTICEQVVLKNSSQVLLFCYDLAGVIYDGTKTYVTSAGNVDFTVNTIMPTKDFVVIPYWKDSVINSNILNREDTTNLVNNILNLSNDVASQLVLSTNIDLKNELLVSSNLTKFYEQITNAISELTPGSTDMITSISNIVSKMQLFLTNIDNNNGLNAFANQQDMLNYFERLVKSSYLFNVSFDVNYLTILAAMNANKQILWNGLNSLMSSQFMLSNAMQMQTVNANRMECIGNRNILKSYLESYVINNGGNSYFDLYYISQANVLSLNAYLSYIQSLKTALNSTTYFDNLISEINIAIGYINTNIINAIQSGYSISSQVLTNANQYMTTVLNDVVFASLSDSSSLNIINQFNANALAAAWSDRFSASNTISVIRQVLQNAYLYASSNSAWSDLLPLLTDLNSNYYNDDQIVELFVNTLFNNTKFMAKYYLNAPVALYSYDVLQQSFVMRNSLNIYNTNVVYASNGVNINIIDALSNVIEVAYDNQSTLINYAKYLEMMMSQIQAFNSQLTEFYNYNPQSCLFNGLEAQNSLTSVYQSVLSLQTANNNLIDTLSSGNITSGLVGNLNNINSQISNVLSNTNFIRCNYMYTNSPSTYSLNIFHDCNLTLMAFLLNNYVDAGSISARIAVLQNIVSQAYLLSQSASNPFDANTTNLLAILNNSTKYYIYDNDVNAFGKLSYIDVFAQLFNDNTFFTKYCSSPVQPKLMSSNFMQVNDYLIDTALESFASADINGITDVSLSLQTRYVFNNNTILRALSVVNQYVSYLDGILPLCSPIHRQYLYQKFYNPLMHLRCILNKCVACEFVDSDYIAMLSDNDLFNDFPTFVAQLNEYISDVNTDVTNNATDYVTAMSTEGIVGEASSAIQLFMYGQASSAAFATNGTVACINNDNGSSVSIALVEPVNFIASDGDYDISQSSMFYNLIAVNNAIQQLGNSSFFQAWYNSHCPTSLTINGESIDYKLYIDDIQLNVNYDNYTNVNVINRYKVSITYDILTKFQAYCNSVVAANVSSLSQSAFNTMFTGQYTLLSLPSVNAGDLDFNLFYMNDMEANAIEIVEGLYEIQQVIDESNRILNNNTNMFMVKNYMHQIPDDRLQQILNRGYVNRSDMYELLSENLSFINTSVYDMLPFYNYLQYLQNVASYMISNNKDPSVVQSVMQYISNMIAAGNVTYVDMQYINNLPQFESTYSFDMSTLTGQYNLQDYVNILNETSIYQNSFEFIQQMNGFNGLNISSAIQQLVASNVYNAVIQCYEALDLCDQYMNSRNLITGLKNANLSLVNMGDVQYQMSNGPLTYYYGNQSFAQGCLYQSQLMNASAAQYIPYDDVYSVSENINALLNNYEFSCLINNILTPFYDSINMFDISGLSDLLTYYDTSYNVSSYSQLFNDGKANFLCMNSNFYTINDSIVSIGKTNESVLNDITTCLSNLNSNTTWAGLSTTAFANLPVFNGYENLDVNLQNIWNAVNSAFTSNSAYFVNNVSEWIKLFSNISANYDNCWTAIFEEYGYNSIVDINQNLFSIKQEISDSIVNLKVYTLTNMCNILNQLSTNLGFTNPNINTINQLILLLNDDKDFVMWSIGNNMVLNNTSAATFSSDLSSMQSVINAAIPYFSAELTAWQTKQTNGSATLQDVISNFYQLTEFLSYKDIINTMSTQYSFNSNTDYSQFIIALRNSYMKFIQSVVAWQNVIYSLTADGNEVSEYWQMNDNNAGGYAPKITYANMMDQLMQPVSSGLKSGFNLLGNYLNTNSAYRSVYRMNYDLLQNTYDNVSNDIMQNGYYTVNRTTDNDGMMQYEVSRKPISGVFADVFRDLFNTTTMTHAVRSIVSDGYLNYKPGIAYKAQANMQMNPDGSMNLNTYNPYNSPLYAVLPEVSNNAPSSAWYSIFNGALAYNGNLGAEYVNMDILNLIQANANNSDLLYNNVANGVTETTDTSGTPVIIDGGSVVYIAPVTNAINYGSLSNDGVINNDPIITMNAISYGANAWRYGLNSQVQRYLVPFMTNASSWALNTYNTSLISAINAFDINYLLYEIANGSISSISSSIYSYNTTLNTILQQMQQCNSNMILAYQTESISIYNMLIGFSNTFNSNQFYPNASQQIQSSISEWSNILFNITECSKQMNKLAVNISNLTVTAEDLMNYNENLLTLQSRINNAINNLNDVYYGNWGYAVNGLYSSENSVTGQDVYNNQLIIFDDNILNAQLDIPSFNNGVRMVTAANTNNDLRYNLRILNEYSQYFNELVNNFMLPLYNSLPSSIASQVINVNVYNSMISNINLLISAIENMLTSSSVDINSINNSLQSLVSNTAFIRSNLLFDSTALSDLSSFNVGYATYFKLISHICSSSVNTFDSWFNERTLRNLILQAKNVDYASFGLQTQSLINEIYTLMDGDAIYTMLNETISTNDNFTQMTIGTNYNNIYTKNGYCYFWLWRQLMQQSDFFTKYNQSSATSVNWSMFDEISPLNNYGFVINQQDNNALNINYINTYMEFLNAKNTPVNSQFANQFNTLINSNNLTNFANVFDDSMVTNALNSNNATLTNYQQYLQSIKANVLMPLFTQYAAGVNTTMLDNTINSITTLLADSNLTPAQWNNTFSALQSDMNFVTCPMFFDNPNSGDCANFNLVYNIYFSLISKLFCNPSALNWPVRTAIEPVLRNLIIYAKKSSSYNQLSSSTRGILDELYTLIDGDGIYTVLSGNLTNDNSDAINQAIMSNTGYGKVYDDNGRLYYQIWSQLVSQADFFSEYVVVNNVSLQTINWTYDSVLQTQLNLGNMVNLPVYNEQLNFSAQQYNTAIDSLRSLISQYNVFDNIMYNIYDDISFGNGLFTPDMIMNSSILNKSNVDYNLSVLNSVNAIDTFCENLLQNVFVTNSNLGGISSGFTNDFTVINSANLYNYSNANLTQLINDVISNCITLNTISAKLKCIYEFIDYGLNGVNSQYIFDMNYWIGDANDSITAYNNELSNISNDISAVNLQVLSLYKVNLTALSGYLNVQLAKLSNSGDYVFDGMNPMQNHEFISFNESMYSSVNSYSYSLLSEKIGDIQNAINSIDDLIAFVSVPLTSVNMLVANGKISTVSALMNSIINSDINVMFNDGSIVYPMLSNALWSSNNLSAQLIDYDLILNSSLQLLDSYSQSINSSFVFSGEYMANKYRISQLLGTLRAASYYNNQCANANRDMIDNAIDTVQGYLLFMQNMQTNVIQPMATQVNASVASNSPLYNYFNDANTGMKVNVQNVINSLFDIVASLRVLNVKDPNFSTELQAISNNLDSAIGWVFSCSQNTLFATNQFNLICQMYMEIISQLFIDGNMSSAFNMVNPEQIVRDMIIYIKKNDYNSLSTGTQAIIDEIYTLIDGDGIYSQLSGNLMNDTAVNANLINNTKYNRVYLDNGMEYVSLLTQLCSQSDFASKYYNQTNNEFNWTYLTFYGANTMKIDNFMPLNSILPYNGLQNSLYSQINSIVNSYDMLSGFVADYNYYNSGLSEIMSIINNPSNANALSVANNFSTLYMLNANIAPSSMTYGSGSLLNQIMYNMSIIGDDLQSDESLIAWCNDLMNTIVNNNGVYGSLFSNVADIPILYNTLYINLARINKILTNGSVNLVNSVSFNEFIDNVNAEIDEYNDVIQSTVSSISSININLLSSFNTNINNIQNYITSIQSKFNAGSSISADINSGLQPINAELQNLLSVVNSIEHLVSISSTLSPSEIEKLNSLMDYINNYGSLDSILDDINYVVFTAILNSKQNMNLSGLPRDNVNTLINSLYSDSNSIVNYDFTATCNKLSNMLYYFFRGTYDTSYTGPDFFVAPMNQNVEMGFSNSALYNNPSYFQYDVGANGMIDLSFTMPNNISNFVNYQGNVNYVYNEDGVNYQLRSEPSYGIIDVISTNVQALYDQTGPAESIYKFGFKNRMPIYYGNFNNSVPFSSIEDLNNYNNTIYANIALPYSLGGQGYTLYQDYGAYNSSNAINPIAYPLFYLPSSNTNVNYDNIWNLRTPWNFFWAGHLNSAYNLNSQSVGNVSYMNSFNIPYFKPSNAFTLNSSNSIMNYQGNGSNSYIMSPFNTGENPFVYTNSIGDGYLNSYNPYNSNIANAASNNPSFFNMRNVISDNVFQNWFYMFANLKIGNINVVSDLSNIGSVNYSQQQANQFYDLYNPGGYQYSSISGLLLNDANNNNIMFGPVGSPFMCALGLYYHPAESIVNSYGYQNTSSITNLSQEYDNASGMSQSIEPIQSPFMGNTLSSNWNGYHNVAYPWMLFWDNVSMMYSIYQPNEIESVQSNNPLYIGGTLENNQNSVGILGMSVTPNGQAQVDSSMFSWYAYVFNNALAYFGQWRDIILPNLNTSISIDGIRELYNTDAFVQYYLSNSISGGADNLIDLSLYSNSATPLIKYDISMSQPLMHIDEYSNENALDASDDYLIYEQNDAIIQGVLNALNDMSDMSLLASVTSENAKVLNEYQQFIDAYSSDYQLLKTYWSNQNGWNNEDFFIEYDAFVSLVSNTITLVNNAINNKDYSQISLINSQMQSIMSNEIVENPVFRFNSFVFHMLSISGLTNGEAWYYIEYLVRDRIIEAYQYSIYGDGTNNSSEDWRNNVFPILSELYSYIDGATLYQLAGNNLSNLTNVNVDQTSYERITEDNYVYYIKLIWDLCSESSFVSRYSITSNLPAYNIIENFYNSSELLSNKLQQMNITSSSSLALYDQLLPLYNQLKLGSYYAITNLSAYNQIIQQIQSILQNSSISSISNISDSLSLLTQFTSYDDFIF